ncbi:four-helix bundle copper-binding protein [Microtetraspora malaysiensis]|uniref:four-helix bundle copper-binding protein n=1 Tax=Microtetraspora malaysiensis TaxID=161358 RepID=UPI003D94469A
MAQTRELFDTVTGKAGLNSEVLARIVDTLQECEEVVAACAMGMLGEQDAMQMASAISRDLDCADIVETTRRVLTRGSGPDNRLISAQFQSCLLACERSHELCSQHAAHHAHCRVCSDATRRCADMCREVLDAIRG